MQPGPARFTPQDMTAFFRQAGLLARGSVDSVISQPADGPFGKSHELHFLRLRYSAAGPHPPPERLFLKFGKSSKEPFFYTNIAPHMEPAALLRCYHAGYDPDSNRACLLLEDLSASHTQTEWPLPPSDAQCSQTIQVIAQVHARWWQHPLLESAFRPAMPLERTWQHRLDQAAASLPAFFDFLGDRLPPARRTVYERVAAAPDRLWRIPPGAPHQTLIHGDLHTWNVFYPREPGSALLRLFDWNMWDIRPAADDLAYLIALHWFPERRARLEANLLAQYHAGLVENGVAGYPLEALRQDYRAALIRALLIPVWQWQRGISPGIWWPHLERGLLAFADLACQDLI